MHSPPLHSTNPPPTYWSSRHTGPTSTIGVYGGIPTPSPPYTPRLFLPCIGRTPPPHGVLKEPPERTAKMARPAKKNIKQTKAVEAYDKLIRNTYLGYCFAVQNAGLDLTKQKPRWVASKLHKYLCNLVDDFVKEETKNPYDVLLISVPPQLGKALDENTPVLTTNGWKRHGDLKVGDYVFNQTGKAVKVLAVQTPYEHDCVKVILDTHEEIICSKEHEWVVECDRDKRTPRKEGRKKLPRSTEVIEAQNIFDGYHAKSPAIKVCEPIRGRRKDLMDPYLLGVWLGDGSSRSTGITCGEEDIEGMIENLSSHPMTVKPHGKSYTINIGVTTGKIGSNKFRVWLKSNGLIRNKHIPEAYFTASKKQRLELLKGLMDTDGCVCAKGKNCEYTGVNKRLVSDVFKLIRSLGMKCSFTTGDATINGRYVGKKYRIQFTPNKGQPLFKLKRKQDRIDRKKAKDRGDKYLYFIKSVEETKRHRVNCITVEGGVYLCGHGMIPTHNSLSITETLPSYYLGHNPEHKVIEISYSEGFAQRFGKSNKLKVQDFGSMFGIELSKSSKSNVDWSLSNERGRMISRGISSGVTGEACNLMIIDDPIKNSGEANSKLIRDRIYDEWINSFRTRLSVGAKVIVIQTRWHEDDLYGRLKNDPYARWINIPAICDDKDDPLGREIGDGICPEIGKGKEWLLKYKEGMISGKVEEGGETGARAWESLFQGRPTAREGNLLKREWWQLYKGEPDVDSKIISVDAAFKDKEQNDYVAIQVWGKKGAKIYLLDAVKAHLNFQATMDVILQKRALFRVNTILIEDKANGTAIIETLRRKIAGVMAVEPKGGKVARVNAVSFAVESGHVYLPSDKPFTNDFIEECASFPNGKHDDQVDCFSQALARLLWVQGDTVREEVRTNALATGLGRKQVIVTTRR